MQQIKHLMFYKFFSFFFLFVYFFSFYIQKLKASLHEAFDNTVILDRQYEK